MDIKQYVGSSIKKRRAEIKMDQETLQDYAEVGATTLSTAENGKANLTLEVLEKILDPLGLEVVIKVKSIK